MADETMRDRIARSAMLVAAASGSTGIEIWRDIADMVLSEMRDPTDAMVKAGVHVVNGWGVSGIPVWESMIDAALGEPRP